MKNYTVTLEKFFNTTNEEILNTIKTYNNDSSESQVRSWQKIILDLKNSSFLKELDPNIVLSIEYQFLVGNMSADIILGGYNNNGKKNALIIEVKEWNDEYVDKTSFSNYRENDRQMHPQVQVNRHKTAFKNYLNVGPQYDVYTAVLAQNVTTDGLLKLSKKNIDSNATNIKCYNDLEQLLKNHKPLLETADENIKTDLENAFYQPSRDVILAMNDIVKREEGFILSEEQQLAMENIMLALKDHKKIIQVDGCAGSGKTAILINLYVSLLNNKDFENNTVVFCSGAQNTALYRSLYKDGEHLFEYSFSLKKKIKNDYQKKWIIIMDEAQHNEQGIIDSLNIENVTLVLAYDKNQAIIATNAIEELENLENDPNYCKINLEKTVRYNNSKYFISNVKKVLAGNKDLIEDDRYDFKILSDIKEVSDKAREIVTTNKDDTFATIGLLSNDYKQIQEFIEHKDSIFFTRWNYKEECKWIPYVNEKNYLNKNDGKIWVGTWWMPGLDVDYAIVIVGPDAKLTEKGLKAVPEKMAEYNMLISAAKKLGFFNSVAAYYQNQFQPKLNNPDTVKNIINYLANHEKVKSEFEEELNQLMQNNYYVMFTRARKGCYVYFMTDETKKDNK